MVAGGRARDADPKDAAIVVVLPSSLLEQESRDLVRGFLVCLTEQQLAAFLKLLPRLDIRIEGD